jgi:glycosyltransferase involved in cell wall biosynthesis
LPEVITHGVDGWVCDELTPRAVADGIEYLLDPAVRERAGAAALASAARYSREEFARQWRQIFGGREPPAGT